MLTRTTLPVLFMLTVAAARLRAVVRAARQIASSDDWCRSERGGNDRETFCEVRQFTAAAAGTMTVDAAPNGGIQVAGEPRTDVRILAKVTAQADTMQRAQ